MGTTLTTLSLLGFDASAVAAQAEPNDLLRSGNAPWLTLVPGEAFPQDPTARLAKLAKALTKGTEGAALHFYYFDDEHFWCSLYQGGKRVASCDSDGSWAKLGKQLDALLGDQLASKAFRLASKCSGLEEQLQLLEEAVGAALYDLVGAEPRKVLRGDRVASAVKAREAALRKRPNRYVLRELPPEQWPKEYLCRQKAFARLCAASKPYLFFSIEDCQPERFTVPGTDRMVQFGPTGEVLVYDEAEDRICGLTAPDTTASRIIGVTEDGTVLVLSFAGGSAINCLQALCADGTEVWRFAPEAAGLEHVHTSPEGIITLFCGCMDAPELKWDGQIWQLDGKTGAILRSVRIPGEKVVHHLTYVPALRCFVCVERSTRELILLSETLEPIRRIPDYEGFYYIEEKHLCGSLLWHARGDKHLLITDLLTGESRSVTLEVGCAFPQRLLPDGRILGVNERMNKLLIYAPDGTMAARFSLEGFLSHVFVRDGKACVEELRFPERSAFSCFFEPQMYEATACLWTVEPAEA